MWVVYKYDYNEKNDINLYIIGLSLSSIKNSFSLFVFTCTVGWGSIEIVWKFSIMRTIMYRLYNLLYCQPFSGWFNSEKVFPVSNYSNET